LPVADDGGDNVVRKFGAGGAAEIGPGLEPGVGCGKLRACLEVVPQETEMRNSSSTTDGHSAAEPQPKRRAGAEILAADEDFDRLQDRGGRIDPVAEDTPLRWSLSSLRLQHRTRSLSAVAFWPGVISLCPQKLCAEFPFGGF
jgi:hypothetical protein